MRDGGAAARADVHLAAASGGMQAAHLLHRLGVPDLDQRLLPDGAQRLAVQHVALAAGVDVAVLFHVHRPAPQVVAGVFPIAGGMAGIGAHQVGLVLLDAQLVHARDALPEAQKVVHLAGVAFHAHHLHHDLEFGAALVLHAREAHEVVAHLFELRALAIELEGLLLEAVEAQGDLFERRIQHLGGIALVQERPVGGEQGGDAVLVAVLDAFEDLRVHERFAQPDQHHVLGGISGLRRAVYGISHPSCPPWAGDGFPAGTSGNTGYTWRWSRRCTPPAARRAGPGASDSPTAVLRDSRPSSLIYCTCRVQIGI